MSLRLGSGKLDNPPKNALVKAGYRLESEALSHSLSVAAGCPVGVKALMEVAENSLVRDGAHSSSVHARQGSPDPGLTRRKSAMKRQETALQTGT